MRLQVPAALLQDHFGGDLGLRLDPKAQDKPEK
jgi:hypothetical protein